MENEKQLVRIQFIIVSIHNLLLGGGAHFSPKPLGDIFFDKPIGGENPFFNNVLKRFLYINL